MISREDQLARYFDEIGTEVDFFETSHCILFMGRWVASQRSNYSVDKWLGSCSCWLDCARLIRERRGIDNIIAEEAEEAGLTSIDVTTADVGDIGLLEAQKPGRGYHITFGCIRTRDFWAIRSLYGITMLRAETMLIKPYRAWRV